MVNQLKSVVTAFRGGVRAGSGLPPSAAAKEVIVVPGHRAGPPGPRGGQQRPRAGHREPLLPGPGSRGPQLLPSGHGQRAGQLPLSPQQVAQRYAHPTPETLLYSDGGARPSWEANLQEEADDVIDLGAPRRVRRPRESLELHPAPRRSTLIPNPRLYPGPKPKSKPKSKPKAQPRRATTEGGRTRRRKRALRPVPNSRLYRPGPPRPPVAPPPPARPRAAWPPPPPPARSLDTASRAALRLQQPSTPPPPPAPPARSSSPVPCEQRLVVTLPEAAARYRPASEHFRARAAPLPPDSGESTPPAACLQRPLPRATADMEAVSADRHSSTPEDRSEGNETLSAPSEFLAEFLSAIMRRQYVEALKYCRLILQYEPHNTTARGFYPLLRHKVARAARSEMEPVAAAECGDSSGDEGAAEGSPKDLRSRQEVMEHSVESCGESEASEASAASEAGDHSSLELDSSDAQRSEPSLSLSRRTDRTHRTDDSGSDIRWESSGSASRSGSDDAGEPDDNGNAPPAHCQRAPLLPDDLENDNASAAAGGEPAPHHTSRLKSDSLASLRRLRAQFACSIK